MKKGRTRVSAGRLARIAEALDVPVSLFFAEVRSRSGRAEDLADRSSYDIRRCPGCVRTREFGKVRRVKR
jgi:hypothetical protein